MGYVTIAAQAMLATVFAWAGLGKVLRRGAYPRFLAELRAMRLVRPGAVPVVGALAVTAELTVAVLLLAPPLARSGFVLAGLTLAALTWAVGVTLRRGTAARCRCFGTAGRELGHRHVVRNGVLLAVAVVGAVPAGPSGAAFAGTVVGLCAGALAAVLVIRLDDVVDLFAT